MTRIRQRLPLETHHAVFEHLHKLLAKHKLFSGKFLGVDSSTMEANASLKAIVRRDTGENYQEMLKRLAKESGIETPTTEQLIALDKKRQGKTLSNKEWVSQTDEDARIAKLKDGRTHMAYSERHNFCDIGCVYLPKSHRTKRAVNMAPNVRFFLTFTRAFPFSLFRLLPCYRTEKSC